MEKSVLEMVGGEKHINPHYDIKAESSSSEGFTGVEINGVRFSNIREMLIYMNKQRDQLTKAKEIIKGLLPCCRNYPQENAEKMEQAEQFIKDIKEND